MSRQVAIFLILLDVVVILGISAMNISAFLLGQPPVGIIIGLVMMDIFAIVWIGITVVGIKDMLHI